MRAGAEFGRRRAKKNSWWKSGKLGVRGNGPAVIRIKKGTMYFTPFWNYQLFVRDPGSYRLLQQRIDPVEHMNLHAPLVEPERKLV